jgi:hypothetical protein
MRICEFDTCAVQVASNGTERPESTSMSGSGVVVMPTRGPDGDIVSWIDEPLLNFEWVDSVVFELAAGVKGGRSPAKRTLDAGCQPVRWLSWPMRHADASAMTSRSVSYA